MLYDDAFKDCPAIPLLDLPKMLLKEHKIKISYCQLRDMTTCRILTPITRDGKECAIGDLNHIAATVRECQA